MIIISLRPNIVIAFVRDISTNTNTTNLLDGHWAYVGFTIGMTLLADVCGLFPI